MLKKHNYYVEEIDNALRGHDPNYPLKIKIFGSKNNSKHLSLPFELARYIKEWYFLNGDKI